MRFFLSLAFTVCCGIGTLHCNNMPISKHSIKETRGESFKTKKIIPAAIQLRYIDFFKHYVHNNNVHIQLAESISALADFGWKKDNFEIHGEIRSDSVDFNAPEGEFFGFIHVTYMLPRPLVYAEMGDLRINFGVKGQGGLFMENNVSACSAEPSPPGLAVLVVDCPKLTLREGRPFQATLSLNNTAQPTLRATAAIWVLGLYVSLRIANPAGMAFPLIIGPVGVERAIDFELQQKER